MARDTCFFKKIEILNLEIPTLTCDLESAFPLKDLNDIIPTNSLQLSSGNATVLLSYKGPIQKNNNTNSFLNGNIAFKNGTMLYAPRNVELKNLNGLISFKNSDVNIQNLQGTVLNNKIVMNGTAKNILTLINTAPNNVKIDYHVFSPDLNLSAFTYLLKKRNRVVKKAVTNKRSFGDMAVKIDDVLEKSIIDLTLDAGRISYRKFSGNNLKASITLLQDRYIINNVSMQAVGGSMGITGQLINANGNYHTASVNANLNGVDVKTICLF